MTRRKAFLSVILFFVLFAAAVAGSMLLSPMQRQTADAAVASSGSVGPTLLKPVDNGREIYENASIYVSYTYPNYMYDSQSTYILKVTYSVSADRLGNMWGADTYSLSTAAVYRKDGNGVYQLYTPTQAFGLVRRHFALGGAKYGSGRINDETDIKKDFEETKKVIVDVPVGAKWSDFLATGDDTTNPSNGNKSLTLTVNEPGEYKAVLWCLGYDAGPVNAQKVEYEFTYGNGANTGNAAGMGSAETAGGTPLSVGAYTNEAITFTAMGGTELYLDGNLQSGTSVTVSSEGQHSFWVEPKIGYRAQYYYFIDKTEPTLSLDGATSGGFTQSGVKAAGSDNMGVASVKYSYNTGGSFPSTAATDYTGQTLTDAGNYCMTVTDHAGNSTSYTFTIDNSAPVLFLNGVSDGGYTNGNVTVSWDTSVTGVSGQRANENDRLSVTYACSADDTFPTETNLTAAVNTKFSQEGNYLIKITDSAGNSTSYTFTIDKTAPYLFIGAETAGERTYGGTPVLRYEDNFPGVTVAAQKRSITVSVDGIMVGEVRDFDVSLGDGLQNGIYTIVLTDEAGNSRSCTFAVIGSVTEYNKATIGSTGYLSSGTYRVKIPYMRSIAVAATGKDGKPSSYPGTWKNTNTYVFSCYENALRFMIEVEMEEAVTDNGNGTYTYYQINNHAATTTYGDVAGAKATMEEFYQALAKYAAMYVSEYSVPSLSSPYIGANTVIMDAEALSGLTPDGVQRIGGDYVFRDENYTFAADGRTFSYSTTAGLRIEHNGRVVFDGAPNGAMNFMGLISSVSSSGAAGGVYTVTETDSVGNKVTYQVYLDRTPPSFLAQYTYYHAYTDEKGDLQSELMSGERELSSNSQIDANLISLVVSKILDNADEIVTAVVLLPDGTSVRMSDLGELTFGADGHFTAGGEYHLKLYDRTGNVFDYVFTIYGGAPRVSTQIRGTGDNRNITISFANANSYSSIVRFAIYRYGERLPAGEYNEIVDGKILNTVYIEQDVWSYTFVLGGVYTVRFEDSFGNVTESEEIVFAKGLPKYTLSGVSDGSKTRKNASLTFENSAGYEVYKDGERVTLPANSVTNGQELEIIASEENNGTWEIKLYVKSDPNTYVIVRFTMDTAAPKASAENEEGISIAWDTTTQTGFRIVWNDTDVERVRYQIDGGLSKTYTAGELLTEDGVYTITLTDDVGNSVTYRITMDTAVKYEIDFNGINTEQGGVWYVRGGFTVVNDEWLEMGIFRDGAKVDVPRFNYEYVTEGAYEITLADGVGNQAIVTVVIDKTAPEIEIRHGADEYSSVTVEVESGDVNSMTVRKDGKAYSIELADEMTFSVWGMYEITLKDMLGNARTETFGIAKKPPKAEILTTDGTEIADGGSTNKSVYIVWDDGDAAARVTLPNGQSRTYTAKTVLMDEGTYTVRITDAAKNVVSVTVTITRTILYKLTAADGTEIEPVWMNERLNATQDFAVTFGADITIQAKKDGESFGYESGQIIFADGIYKFILKDSVGNEERFAICHDVTPPEVTVTAGERDTDAVTVTVGEAGAVIVLTHVAAGKKYTSELTGKTEYVFADWGEYTLEISDVLGNTVRKSFTVAKVPPQIYVVTTAGSIVPDGAFVNSAVYIECNADDVVIRYRVGNGFSHIYKNGTVLSGQGMYEITARDIAGTEVTITFTLDSEVLAEAWIDGGYVRTMSDHISGKGYIDFEFGESLSLDCTRDGAPYSVSATDGALRISDEGKYILTLTDGVGNVMTVMFTIDRTAPVFELSTDASVTKDDVAVILDDLSDVDSYKLMTDGRKANNFVLDTLNTFDSEASYQLTLADALGNTATVSFRIRRSIEYSLSIPDAFMTADDVTLTLRQTANVSAMRNGAVFETKAENGAYRFSEDGSYSLTLTDELGNVVTLTFEIKSNPYTAKFEYTIPRDSTYKLVRDGVTLAEEEYVEGDKIVVTEDGEYTLTLRRGGRTGIFTFIVDTLLPALVLNGTEYASGARIPNLKSDFTIAANKSACSIEVFYNGVSVPYSTDAQSANGQYKVVITDALGNVAEYEFQKDFTFNAGAITLFAVGGAAVVLVILLLVRRRIKMRIR